MDHGCWKYGRVRSDVRRRIKQQGVRDPVESNQEESGDRALWTNTYRFLQCTRIFTTGRRIQIKFTKVRTGFYLMNKDAESKTVFQFLDAQLWVKGVRPTIPLAHKAVLDKGGVARYNMTRVELKSFTFLVDRNRCQSIMRFSAPSRSRSYSL